MSAWKTRFESIFKSITKSRVKKMARGFFFHTLIGVLISQLALSPLAFANDPADSGVTADHETPHGGDMGGTQGEPGGGNLVDDEAQAEAKAAADGIIEALETRRADNARFALSAVERNAGMMLNQFMVDPKTGGRWDLSFESVTKPDEKLGPGIAQRSLIITKIENGLRLGAPGYPYVQEIFFAKLREDGSFSDRDVQLLDADWDDETVELLLSDGSRHYLEVSSIEEFMFNSAIPMLYRGVARGVGGLSVNRIKKIKRRFDPIDKSRKHEEGSLNLSPATLRRAQLIADDEMALRLEENWHAIAPVAVHPDLEPVLRRRNPEGKLIHEAGDVALIHDDGVREVMIGWDSSLATVGIGGMQMDVLAGLRTLAAPDLGRMARDMAALGDSGKRAIAEFVEDRANLGEESRAGLLRAAGKMSPAGFNKFNAWVARVFKTVEDAKKNGTPATVRDSFTQEEWVKDHALLKEVVDAAQATAAENRGKPNWDVSRNRGWRRFWNLGKGASIKNFVNPARRMRQLTTVLKYPVIKRAVEKHKFVAAATAAAVVGVSADYMLMHGEHVAPAIDLVMKLWGFVIQHVSPVMQSPSYLWDMARYSLSVRVGLLLSVIAAAALIAPMTQHGTNKFIVINGIKYFFSEFIRPIPRLLFAPLPTGPEFLRAVRRGHFPTALLDPMDEPSLVPKFAAVSAKIDRDKELMLTAKAIAIATVAARRGIDVFELLQEAKLEEAQNLAIHLADLLIRSEGRDLANALVEHGPDFTATLGKVEEAARQLDARGSMRPHAFPYLRMVVMTELLTGFGNLGEHLYEELKNPQPSEAFSKYVIDGYIMDGIFTIGSTTLVGRFAELSMPDKLAYQPEIPFFHTQPYLVIGDGEQAGLHLGLNSANDYQSFARDVGAPFSAYRPAAELDFDRVQASRAAWKDIASLARLTVDLRSNNYLIMFGERSFNQCVRLLRGFLLLGIILRLFESTVEGAPFSEFFTFDNLKFSSIGQMYFIYRAPFEYRYWWAWWVQTYQSLAAFLKGLGGDFGAQLVQLQSDASKGNFPAAKRRAIQMISRYEGSELAIPAEVKQAVQEVPGESDEVWLTRVLQTLRANPTVPEQVNGKVTKGCFFVLALVTTALASFLMDDSFAKMNFWGDGRAGTWGFDPTDWFAFNGLSPHDSVPVWVMKTMLNLYAVWLAGHGINIGVDTLRLRSAKAELENAEGSGAAQAGAAREKVDEARGNLAGSVRKLGTVPGVSWLPIRAIHPPKPSVPGNPVGTCAALLEDAG